MSPNARLLFTTIAAAVLGAGCAAASPVESVTSASYGTWEASNPTWLRLPFSSLPTDTSPPLPTSVPLTSSGNTFTFSNSSGITEFGAALEASSITVTEPSGGETSMLIFLGDNSYAGANSFTLTFSDGSTGSLGVGLYAISSTTPITSFTVNASSPIALEDLVFVPTTQTQDPVPEAATFILTSSGLLILLGSGQRLMQKRIL